MRALSSGLCPGARGVPHAAARFPDLRRLPYVASRNAARCTASLTPGLSRAALDADGFALADIAVADGKIAAIAARTTPPPPAAIDLAGRIVLPCFVDCHTHIDKGHIWPRKPNPDGSFMGALDAAGEDRAARWSAADVARRMDFSLRSAYAHGTKALRTHIDSVAAAGGDLLAGLRGDARALARPDRAAGRLPASASRACATRHWFAALAKRVAAARGVLGAVTYMVPDLEELLDRVFALAIEHGLDLDFHADETDDVSAVSLKKIAEAALWNGFEGKILVGHCCSLARQPDRDVLDTLDKVAQGRHLRRVAADVQSLSAGPPPRRHDAALARRDAAARDEGAGHSGRRRLRQHARSVLCLWRSRHAGSLPHGDAHPASRPSGRRLAESGRRDAGRNHAARRQPGVLAAGGPADFIIFKGRSWTELLSRPESDRIVVRDGKAIERDMPDYAELDDLMV